MKELEQELWIMLFLIYLYISLKKIESRLSIMSEKIRKQERQPYFKGEINPAYFVINISKKLKYNYKNNIIKNYINKK